jgi:hypothetical protein
MSNPDSNMQVESNNNTPSSVLGNGDGAHVAEAASNGVPGNVDDVAESAVNVVPGDVAESAVNVVPGDVDEVAANVDPNAVNVDPNAVNVDPNAVNVDPNAVNVDPNAVNVDPNAVNVAPGDGAEGVSNAVYENPAAASQRPMNPNARNYFSKLNEYTHGNTHGNTPGNTPENAQSKGMFPSFNLSSLNPSSFNLFNNAVAKRAEITGKARDGSLRINLYKVDNGFAAEVVPINGEAIPDKKSLPVVADLLGKPDKLGIAAAVADKLGIAEAVINKPAGGKSRKRRTIRKNGGYNSARFFSVTKKRAHRNKSANKKQYVNKSLRK